VLAAVAIGGRWGLPGVVGGALLVAFYDRALVDAISAGLRALGQALGSPLLQGVDLRGDNFLIFGLLLYLATVVPGRLSEPSSASLTIPTDDRRAPPPSSARRI
jgi:hypothetical protein